MKISKSDIKFMQGDPKVWDSIDSGDTDFVFQFSSPGMKGLCTSTAPRTIDNLAELNALYRPGPLEAGYADKYKLVKQGKDAQFTLEETVISNVLKEIFGQKHSGLMIFQEDVMRICTECCGFTMTEADDIRKAMGKKKEEVLAEWEPKFVQGWDENMLAVYVDDHVFQLDDLLDTDAGIMTAKEMYDMVQDGREVEIYGQHGAQNG